MRNDGNIPIVEIRTSKLPRELLERIHREITAKKQQIAESGKEQKKIG